MGLMDEDGLKIAQGGGRAQEVEIQLVDDEDDEEKERKDRRQLKRNGDRTLYLHGILHLLFQERRQLWESRRMSGQVMTLFLLLWMPKQRLLRRKHRAMIPSVRPLILIANLAEIILSRYRGLLRQAHQWRFSIKRYKAKA